MRIRTYPLIIISYMMAMLLAYTATRKLLDYASYEAHVRDVELFAPDLAVWAARAAIAVEYGLALILLVPLGRIQIWGWKGVALLMAIYGYYVYHVLHYAPFTPCSCKGVTEKLSWTGHGFLIMGLALLALAILLLYYGRWIRRNKHIVET